MLTQLLGCASQLVNQAIFSNDSIDLAAGHTALHHFVWVIAPSEMVVYDIEEYFLPFELWHSFQCLSLQ